MQGTGNTDQAGSTPIPSHSHLVLEAPQVLVVPVKRKHGERRYKSS